MARNVEIKIRVDDLAAVRAQLAQLSDQPPDADPQTDFFFNVPHGRLKVRRRQSGQSELIFYDRPDEPSPRLSRYHRVPLADADAMIELLDDALGQCGTVVKKRDVYLVGRTRINVDQVAGLGSFVELEAVLDTGEHPENGYRDVARLLETLGLADHPPVGQPYVELLETAKLP